MTMITTGAMTLTGTTAGSSIEAEISAATGGTEFGVANNDTLSLDDFRVRNLADQLTSGSAVIMPTNFYGKTYYANNFYETSGTQSRSVSPIIYFYYGYSAQANPTTIGTTYGPSINIGSIVPTTQAANLGFYVGTPSGVAGPKYRINGAWWYRPQPVIGPNANLFFISVEGNTVYSIPYLNNCVINANSQLVNALMPVANPYRSNVLIYDANTNSTYYYWANSAGSGSYAGTAGWLSGITFKVKVY